MKKIVLLLSLSFIVLLNFSATIFAQQITVHSSNLNSNVINEVVDLTVEHLDSSFVVNERANVNPRFRPLQNPPTEIVNLGQYYTNDPLSYFTDRNGPAIFYSSWLYEIDPDQSFIIVDVTMIHDPGLSRASGTIFLNGSDGSYQSANLNNYDSEHTRIVFSAVPGVVYSVLYVGMVTEHYPTGMTFIEATTFAF